MAGKQEKLNAYKVATDLALHLAHATATSEMMPDALGYQALGSSIGIMADLEIGSNTRYRRRKAYWYVNATRKLARINSIIVIMNEVGWVSKEEFKVLNLNVESLGKMIWGLVKSLNRINGAGYKKAATTLATEDAPTDEGKDEEEGKDEGKEKEEAYRGEEGKCIIKYIEMT